MVTVRINEIICQSENDLQKEILSQRPSIDLICVIDVSASMRG